MSFPQPLEVQMPKHAMTPSVDRPRSEPELPLDAAVVDDDTAEPELPLDAAVVDDDTAEPQLPSARDQSAAPSAERMGRARFNIGRPMTWVAVAASALVVVALVWGAVTLQHDSAVNAARSSALQAARSDAIALASYNFRHLRHDFGVVEARSTSSFRRSYASSSAGLIQVLTRYHASAKAEVLAAGVASVSPQRAVVILFVNQTVTNTTQTSGPTTDESRVEITLVRGGSGWLIDRVQLR